MRERRRLTLSGNVPRVQRHRTLVPIVGELTLAMTELVISTHGVLQFTSFCATFLLPRGGAFLHKYDIMPFLCHFHFQLLLCLI